MQGERSGKKGQEPLESEGKGLRKLMEAEETNKHERIFGHNKSGKQ